MGSLRLYAIAIDEVRDIFSAPEATATALRAIAAERFPSPVPASPGLLAKLGPLFSRAVDAPVIRPDVPSGSDVDALLAGRFVPPERLPASWLLLEAWIDAMSWGHHEFDLDEASLSDFDFELARAGVAARYGLRGLLTTELGIAMRPAPGLVAGFVRLAHVQALTVAWRDAEANLTGTHRDRALDSPDLVRAVHRLGGRGPGGASRDPRSGEHPAHLLID